MVRIDGRDHCLGRHGSPESWVRYHRLLAERSAGLPRRGPATPSAAITVAELILAFWKFAEGHYRRPDGSPGGELDNLKLAVRPLRKLYGSTLAADFGPRALKTVRQSMIASGLVRTTTTYRVGKVVRVFNWAVENELVPPSSHHALRAVSGLKRGRTSAPESPPVRPVADADVIRPFVTRQVWSIVQVQRLTAARSGEVVIMRSGDIDRSGEVWVYTPREHKTDYLGHRRSIVVGPRAREVLTPWLRADPDAFLFSPRDAVEERNAARRAARVTPMTPSQRARRRKIRRPRTPGDFYSKSAYREAIWRGCDRAFPHPILASVKAKDLTPDQAAELKAWRKAHHWHPHQLRHAAATAIRARSGLEAAQVVLGHAKADVTQVYAERDLARAAEVMREVG